MNVLLLLHYFDHSILRQSMLASVFKAYDKRIRMHFVLVFLSIKPISLVILSVILFATDLQHIYVKNWLLGLFSSSNFLFFYLFFYFFLIWAGSSCMHALNFPLYFWIKFIWMCLNLKKLGIGNMWCLLHYPAY